MLLPNSFLNLPPPTLFLQSHLTFCLLTLLSAIMSARELRSLQSGATSPPKRGRKRGQSNTEATTTKRTKRTTKSDDEGSMEEEPEAVKTKGKAAGKKGKKAR